MFCGCRKDIDIIQSQSVLQTLRNNDVPNGIISMIEDIYTNNYSKAKTNKHLLGGIPDKYLLVNK